MGKGAGCFYCKWHKDGKIEEPGWTYGCAKGLDNTDIKDRDDVLKCPQGRPCFGFQIGGYYTHMELVDNDAGIPPAERNNSCLEWRIWSDGEFPRGEPFKDEPSMEFHLCDFDQLKDFVDFWSKVLGKTDDSSRDGK
jgi:hypothetical protein